MAAPRVAAAQACEGEFAAFECSVGAQGFVGIGRAGGEKTAVSAQKQRQAVAVNPDEGAEEKGHEEVRQFENTEKISVAPLNVFAFFLRERRRKIFSVFSSRRADKACEALCVGFMLQWFEIQKQRKTGRFS